MVGRTRAALAAVMAALALAACGDEQTGIILEVDTTMAVPQEVDGFRVEVTSSRPEPLVETFDLRGGGGDAGAGARRPARLGLRPADPDKPTAVKVVAFGLHTPGAGQPPVKVVRNMVQLSFQRGEVRTVGLSLSPACTDVACPLDEICNGAGICVPVPGGAAAKPDAAAAPDGSGRDGGTGDRLPSPDGGAASGTPDALMGLPPADGAATVDQAGGAPTADGPAPAVDTAGTPPPSPDAAQPTVDARPPADPPVKQDAPVMADAAPPPPPKRALGETCQAGGECQSGFCAEGLCCDRACSERCHSCRGTETGGSNGRCAPASAGRDPGNHCAAQPPASCGLDGACDGQGGCRSHGSNVECAPAACDGNTHVPARRCTGGGACAPGTPRGCGNHVCAAAGCPTTCQSHDQCLPSAYCNGSACDPRKGLGEPCSSDRECNAAVGLGCLLGLCTL